MDVERAMEIAKQAGFDAAFPLNPKTLEFRQDVRDMCAADKCHRYDKSWACPPACGGLDEITVACAPYTEGILVQTISRDYVTLMEDGRRHGQQFTAFVDQLRQEDPSIRPMGAGGCRRCEKCTYPDEPCVSPELVFPSMEASGLLIIDVCKKNDVQYNYGPRTVAYMACCLFNPVTAE